MRALHRFILTLLLVLFGLIQGLPASAEPILAAIITADLPRYRQAHDAMAKILETGGFGAGKLKVFVQTPNPDKMSLANSLRRCQAAGATLVVTYGGRTTEAAQTELKDIPLLFADVYDPVAQGTVKSLAAPGADATGATSKTDRQQLLGQVLAIKPIKSLGILYSKGEIGSEQQLEELTALAKQAGIAVSSENVRNPNEALKLAEKLAGKTEALYLTESIPVGLKATEIVAKAQGPNCLVFSQIPGLVQQGSLLGLEADPEEQGKLVAVHALQVLQGKQAHLLPVREAKKIKLKVNQTTANQLGLTIPPAVSGAAEVVN